MHRRDNHTQIHKSDIKTLYHLIQCLHHKERTQQKSDTHSHAFSRKRRELHRFLKPAQETTQFREKYNGLVNKFISETVRALSEHYNNRINTLIQKIKDKKAPKETIETASQIGLRWAKRNFGKKLSTATVRRFQVLTTELCNTFGTDGDNVSVERRGSRQGLLPTPTRPATPQSTPRLLDTPSAPLPQRLPPTRRRRSTPTQQTGGPRTPSPPSVPHLPLASPQSPIKEPIPAASPSTLRYNGGNIPAPSTPAGGSSRTGPPTVVTNSSQHSPSTPPPRMPTRNQIDLQQRDSGESSIGENGDSPPVAPPRNVEGRDDPLSNFYPCKLEIEGIVYKSSEQAYQHAKARHLNEEEHATRILDTDDPEEANFIGKEINRRNYRTEQYKWPWELSKRYIMEDILWEKAQQCPEFEKALIESGKSRLTHFIPSKFWGTTHRIRGKEMEGENQLAVILVKMRSILLTSQYPTPLKPNPQPTNTRRHSSPQRTLSSPNRYAILGNLEHSSSPPNRQIDSASTPPTQERTFSQVVRTPSQRTQGVLGGSATKSTPNKVSGPHSTNHSDRNEWKIPQVNSKVLILGDSNMKRPTRIDSKGHSIEIHSFPGAKLCSFEKMLRAKSPIQDGPEKVIISVGINNRDNQPMTHKTQSKSLIELASKKFPTADIYIPQVNIPSRLQPNQKASLQALNASIQELASKSKKFKTLPTLPHRKFKIDPKDTKYQIHWTEETANEMLKHWLQHLN